MTLRQVSSAIALIVIVLCASVVSSQTLIDNRAGDTPTFRLLIMGRLDPEFTERVSSYHDLRVHLEERLPPQVVTDNATEIRARELALARLVRIARHGAHEGDLFTAASVMQFKEALQLVMTSQTWAVIMDDNPGAFSHRINGNYPKKRPLSTMPYNILAQLPALPDGIEYRFLGRHLILHDTKANVILDRIRSAIRCTGCDS